MEAKLHLVMRVKNLNARTTLSVALDSSLDPPIYSPPQIINLLSSDLIVVYSQLENVRQ